MGCMLKQEESQTKQAVVHKESRPKLSKMKSKDAVKQKPIHNTDLGFDWEKNSQNLIGSEVSVQAFRSTVGKVKAMGLDLPFEFGSSCSLCQKPNLGERALCSKCDFSYCQYCYRQQVPYIECRKHQLAYFSYPISTILKQALFTDPSLFLQKYDCPICQTMTQSAVYQFFSKGESIRTCEGCRAKAESSCKMKGVLLVPFKERLTPQYVLDRDNRLFKLISLLYSCHSTGLSTLKIVRGNLVQYKHKLFICEQGKEQINCPDPVWTDKTDVFLAGMFMKSGSNNTPLQNMLTELCTQTDPADRPNSAQLYQLFHQFVEAESSL